MSDSGALFYDKRDIFETYQKRRHSATSANDTLEKPILWDILGQVDGLDVMDLGCGEGHIARELFEKGIQSYTGMDSSERMIEAAEKTLADLEVRLYRDFLEGWLPDGEYDLVLSRLAFHYIEHLQPIFERVYECLRPGGRFVFSTEHPVLTSHQVTQKDHTRQDWVVDRYFQTGQRQISWLGGEVFKYHRTVEDFFMLLQETGFEVTHLRESRPRPELFEDSKLFERRSRVPLYLILGAKK